MSTLRPFSRWAYPLLFACLAVSMACSSTTDSSSNAAGATNGGNANASAGSSGSSVAGAVSVAGGASGAPSQGGGGGSSAQAGAAAGGTTSAGAAGTPAGGSAGGGTSGASGAAGATSAGSGGASTGAFALTSPALIGTPDCAPDNKTACPVFPKENIGTSLGGSNKSPEFDWTAGPSGTQSYALVMQDLTNVTGTPAKPFVHWVMWNIPSATRMLPAGLETTAMPTVPAGASQRSFSTSSNGFQGSGKCGNVYEFTLYALPTATYTGTSTSQTAVRDGLATTSAPTASLRARSGAPGCTE